jgi:hypothetical protein
LPFGCCCFSSHQLNLQPNALVQQRAGGMTEDAVYVSELLVVEAAHKSEQEGAMEVIQMLHLGLEQSLHSQLKNLHSLQ